jgi:diguanylate cyclase (GGDEF)-like protein
VWYTIDGRGPFADESLNLSLLLLLAFISTSVATGLMLSAAVDERSRATGKLAQALHDLQEQASTDPLTGLSNRRHLWEFLLREWIRSRRREGSLAVIMMDLDYFKRVNDEFGHEAGDVVLTEIAALLKAHIRGSDIACRFGGEEFALVLPDATLEAVQRRAENIRAAIHRLDLKYRGQPLGGITASFGIALAPDHAGDPESLLRASDRALYEAKAAGRDRIVVSSARNVRAKQPRKTEAA